MGRNQIHEQTLEYDYLVIALGSNDNFFGMSDIEENAFTMKTINDAIILRNHMIKILEQAHVEKDNRDLKKFADFYSCWRRFQWC
jgi:NADH:quinone reductase (non-electrogenic)